MKDFASHLKEVPVTSLLQPPHCRQLHEAHHAHSEFCPENWSGGVSFVSTISNFFSKQILTFFNYFLQILHNCLFNFSLSNISKLVWGRSLLGPDFLEPKLTRLQSCEMSYLSHRANLLNQMFPMKSAQIRYICHICDISQPCMA